MAGGIWWYPHQPAVAGQVVGDDAVFVAQSVAAQVFGKVSGGQDQDTTDRVDGGVPGGQRLTLARWRVWTPRVGVAWVGPAVPADLGGVVGHDLSVEADDVEVAAAGGRAAVVEQSAGLVVGVVDPGGQDPALVLDGF